jgi:carboxylate-amine ligase
MPVKAVREVGVEEEFLLVDAAQLQAAPDAAAVVEEASRRLPELSGDGGGVAHEYKREQVETGSAPRTDLAELASDLRGLRAALSASARSLDRELVAVGTCPLRVVSTTTPDKRHRK